MNRKPAEPRAKARRPLGDRAPRTRAVVAAAGLLVICAAPFAGAATGDVLREGVRNGTTTAETQIISNLATTTRPTGGYSMRMSNLSSTGGGFINGCRASAAATSKPCYRANNLSDGRAFEFNSNNGTVVGTITVGTGGDDKKPFTTNATGVADGLNADRLDSLDASQIIATARTKTGLDADTLDGIDSAGLVQKSELLWALVDAAGGLVAGSGATAAVKLGGTGDYRVTFNRPVNTCVTEGTATDVTGGSAPQTNASRIVGTDNRVQADNTTVDVSLTDAAGAAADALAGDGFTLTVYC